MYGELGVTKPYGHALSRPAEVEVEATARSIKLAEIVDTPIYVVHVMSKGAMEEVCMWVAASFSTTVPLPRSNR